MQAVRDIRTTTAVHGRKKKSRFNFPRTRDGRCRRVLLVRREV